MRPFYFLFLTFHFLVACSSLPKFQKAIDGDGYSINDLTGRNHFEVSLLFQTKFPEQITKKYGWRVVGEECLSCGFSFFSLSDDSALKFQGFCCKENVFTGLGVTFEDQGLKKQPAEFLVESLNNKNSTSLKLGDKIVSVEKTKLTSMSNLRALMITLPAEKASVTIEFERAGKPQKAIEPLANIRGALLGKSDLENLRKSVR